MIRSVKSIFPIKILRIIPPNMTTERVKAIHHVFLSPGSKTAISGAFGSQ